LLEGAALARISGLLLLKVLLGLKSQWVVVLGREEPGFIVPLFVYLRVHLSHHTRGLGLVVLRGELEGDVGVGLGARLLVDVLLLLGHRLSSQI